MAEKVAIVHDWLNGMRGGEKVLEEILTLYPQADVFTLFYEPEKVSEKINAHRVFPSGLNRHSFARKHYRYFLPWLPAQIEEFNLQEYDLVISSSHCVAKGAIPSPRAPHFCYIHSPMRYAWDQYYTYFPRASGLKKGFVRRRISRLRAWDVSSASRVDHFIANSHYVRQRVEKYYRRPAEVIHPPVDVDFYCPGEESPSRDYFLLVSALVPYKNIPLIVEAFIRMGEKLVIVGCGTEARRLRRMAEKNIEFRGLLMREDLRRLYRNAAGLVFGGIEDFGIFFVEALACGTPVIAYGAGGVLDVVEPDRHGLLFNEPTVEAVIRAVKDFSSFSFAPESLRERALEFSPSEFRRRFIHLIRERTS